MNQTKGKSVCLAILNYNGIKHLQHILPTLNNAIKTVECHCSIIVIDNNSTENDLEWLRNNYSEIEILALSKNDYLFSYNDFCSNRKEEICIFLNNDLKVDSNFIKPLLKHFSDSSTFAVSARSYDWDGLIVTSGPFLFSLHHGLFYITKDIGNQHPSYTLFAWGGCMAVDREKFLALGGFDRLYYPAYGEELDLCFRAWAKGWASIYEPASVVFHKEGGSFNASGDCSSSKLILRSQFLFQWRNLRQPYILIESQLYLLWLILRKWIRNDQNWLEVYFETKKIWAKRKCEALKNKPNLVNLKELKKICGQRIN
jgi:GT2 family glycosyltransferase